MSDILPSPSRSTRHPVMTQLQNMISLAHSHEVSEQQRAALKLSELCETYHHSLFRKDANAFPPFAHAISKLLNSGDKLIIAYSARALKMIVSSGDSAFLKMVVSTGVVGVVVRVAESREGEVELLRELLAILQTLSWGGSSDSDGVEGTRSIIENGGSRLISSHLSSKDRELRILSLSCAMNILGHGTSVPRELVIEWIGPLVNAASTNISIIKSTAICALANAVTAYSLDTGISKELAASNARAVFMAARKSSASMFNSHGSTSPVGVCSEAAQRAFDRLGGSSDLVDSESGTTYYRFKWGNAHTIRASYMPGGKGFRWLFLIVVCALLFLYFLSMRTS